MIQTATDIYQDFLDESSRAFFEREYESLADQMIFPHKMETLDGTMEFEERGKFMEAAASFHAYLDDMRTRDYFRICKTAEFLPGSSDQIIGTHETYILQTGGYVVKPVLNRMSMAREGGKWKAAGIRAFVENATIPILSPKQLRERALKIEQAAPLDERGTPKSEGTRND